MKDNKFTIIFFGVLAVFVIVMVIYFMSVFSSIENNKKDAIDIKKANILIKDSVKINQDRATSYAKNDSDNISRNSGMNVNFDKFFVKSKKKDDENKVQGNNEKPQEKQRIVYVREKPQNKTQKEENKENVQEKKVYGFTSVMTANNEENKNAASTKDNSAKREKFINAFLEEETKISNKTYPVFILNEDTKIAGIQFPVMSVIYTQAFSEDTYFDVFAYQIMNISNGRVYPVHLVLYNEKYGRGIKYEGNFNKAAKSEGNDAAQQTSLNVQSTYTQQGIQLVKQGIQKLQGEYSETLKKNWNCYFKEETDEKK